MVRDHQGPQRARRIRATKKSLNYESDELYASWQHGMELLANIWGTPESIEGMNAFLDKRKAGLQAVPDAQQGRARHLPRRLPQRPQRSAEEEEEEVINGCTEQHRAGHPVRPFSV